MNKLLIYIALIIITLGGCKKVELPPTEVNEPIFSINANLDNVSLDWSAGDDDFYMFTEFSKDNFNIYSLTGKLAKDDNCLSDCEESLTFSIRSGYATPSINDFQISEALQLGTFDYSQEEQSTDGKRYFFTGDFSNPITGANNNIFTWKITSDSIYEGAGENFVFEYFDSLDFNLRMEVFSPNCGTSYFERNIPFGSSPSCDLSILPEMMGDDFTLTPLLNGSANQANFTWNNQPNPIGGFIVDTNSVLGNGQISLDVFSQVCSLELGLCAEIGFDSLGFFVQNLGIPNLSYDVEDIIIQDEQFSHVLIEYNDGNDIYNSKNGLNDNFSNSTFTITKIEDFEDNEHGEKTKKLTISYNCILYNSVGESKQIEGTGIIAVAYPN